MKKERVIKSSGNVFVELGFEPAEAQVLALRADLMVRLRRLIEERSWTQVEAARAWHRSIPCLRPNERDIREI